jgi:AmiR/NasT family two-component response regulator
MPDRSNAQPEPVEPLRVLIANELVERLDRVSHVVEGLGHEVVARSFDPQSVGLLSRERRADVALVGLGLDSGHALDLIDQIVREASCPVIALLDARDPGSSTKRRSVGSSPTSSSTAARRSSRTRSRSRCGALRSSTNLQGGFGRRATIEQAKGILMARNGIDADDAFALLKLHSQRSGQKLVDVAEAITRTHTVLAPDPAVGVRPAET